MAWGLSVSRAGRERPGPVYSQAIFELCKSYYTPYHTYLAAEIFTASRTSL